jgi:threonylcarbamoyladenosine tRNA methylthiotransferase MtaB
VAEYHVENFGCRASRADGEIVSAELRQRGMRPAASAAQADVIVANTCSVTAQADRTARAFLRRVHRENPAARILVTGCYAQRAPHELAAMPGVHAVIGNSHKALLSAIASEQAPPIAGFVPLASLPAGGTHAAIWADDAFAHAELAMPAEGWSSGWSPAVIGGQTRPNLKVQDGCGNRCTFCIIPTTRGHSRSQTLQSCLQSVQQFAAAGGVELVLSGINLGRWGRDLAPQQTLPQLVQAILTQTTLPRLRLSSIEPMDWTSELLALFHEYAGANGGRLARHAHVPLQSGSDAILRAMHRRYRPWHYAEKVRVLRQIMPDAAIGADVMVGFPGETDALFQESLDFIVTQPFTYLHLFPFSARPGTRAWQLAKDRPIAPRAVTERMAQLRDLIANRNASFRDRFVGHSLPAVTLQAAEHALPRALTDNFLEVSLAQPIPANRNVHVHIRGLTEGGLSGTIVA